MSIRQRFEGPSAGGPSFTLGADGIEANREQLERYAESTLSAAPALNPHAGYDKATEIVSEAAA